MKNHFIHRHALPLVVLASLTACTSVVQVKEVTADPDAYLRQHFSATDVAPAVATKLPKINAGGFKNVTIVKLATVEGSDGKKENNVSAITYVNNGNGLISTKNDIANNGISYGLSYALTYQGLLTLRSQIVPLRLQTTGAIYEIKELVDMTSIPTEIGQSFKVRYKTGATMQMANFQEIEKTCSAARRFPASELNKQLLGNAVEFACEERANNTVQGRSTWAMLEQYGFAVQTEHTNPSTKTTYKITEVRS